MVHVVFTSNLKRHVDCPDAHVEGETVRDVLDAVFADNRTLRGYVLDDQQRLRRHMAVFVDNKPILDNENLSDPVHPNGEVYVMQALSGG